MCLILLAIEMNAAYPLVVAANRDEFFDRPTAVASFWDKQTAQEDAGPSQVFLPPGGSILAGRDLRAGGTWMGVSRSGRFAALTNFREQNQPTANAPSRGEIVTAFLESELPATEFWQSLALRIAAYSGFNLICGDIRGGLWHFSNRGTGSGQRLGAGIYGVSNHLLDTPWPKVAEGKKDLELALQALPEEAGLFRLLRDDQVHADADLPRTGVDLRWERLLSAAFVRSPSYGTRSSTVLLLDRQGEVSFDEQTYLPGAQLGGLNRFRFTLEDSLASRI